MFYVSKGKIYSDAPKDDGSYVELKLIRKDDETFELKVVGTTPEKPKDRQVCSWQELLAQFSTTPVEPTVVSKAAVVAASVAKGRK